MTICCHTKSSWSRIWLSNWRHLISLPFKYRHNGDCFIRFRVFIIHNHNLLWTDAGTGEENSRGELIQQFQMFLFWWPKMCWETFTHLNEFVLGRGRCWERRRRNQTTGEGFKVQISSKDSGKLYRLVICSWARWGKAGDKETQTQVSTEDQRTNNKSQQPPRFTHPISDGLSDDGWIQDEQLRNPEPLLWSCPSHSSRYWRSEGVCYMTIIATGGGGSAGRLKWLNKTSLTWHHYCLYFISM